MVLLRESCYSKGKVREVTGYAKSPWTVIVKENVLICSTSDKSTVGVDL
ncbi:uncharacterized protein G2W53_013953 [Senna tora]|uniref:Uncharacterized protein n=1 Tax=Senna tora TaxID=362788 RepID=A0A834WPV4_9FABA|nr:uncharacterized protein G2W53_013953 [Senna tora]